MSTRSCVAIKHEVGWRGRYIHMDGYPSGVGVELIKILARDGYDKAVTILLEQHYGWSSLDAASPSDKALSPVYDDGRFKAVPGYGIAYTTQDGQSSPEQWITDVGDTMDAEWAYVLQDHPIPASVAIYERQDGWKLRGVAMNVEQMAYWG